MIWINDYNIRIDKNIQIKFNCLLCCFKKQCLHILTFLMEKKNKKFLLRN